MRRIFSLAILFHLLAIRVALADFIEPPEVDENPTFISPPYILPVGDCDMGVGLSGTFTQAYVEIELIQVSATHALLEVAPNEAFSARLPVAAAESDTVRARQLVGTQSDCFTAPNAPTNNCLISDWRQVVVGPAKAAPELRLSQPILECGSILTVLDARTGADVELYAESYDTQSATWSAGSLVATVPVSVNPQDPNQAYAEISSASTTGFAPTRTRFYAQQSLCGQTVVSPSVVLEPAPQTTPPVVFLTSFPGPSMSLTALEVLPGATIRAFEAGSGMIWDNNAAMGGPGPWDWIAAETARYPVHSMRTWGVPDLTTMCFEQELLGCGMGPSSQVCTLIDWEVPSGGATPCEDVLPPFIQPPRVGDDYVELVEVHPTITRVRIYAGGTEIADAPPSRLIGLSRPLLLGEEIVLLAETALPGCPTTMKAFSRVVRCSDSGRLMSNPVLASDAPTVYPVGHHDYRGGTVTLVDGRSLPLAGRVYYPAVASMEKAAPAMAPSTFPVAIVSHGVTAKYVNESSGALRCQGGGGFVETESFKGYEVLGRSLARRGYIVISVDAQPLNCGSPSPWNDDIDARADLITTTAFNSAAGVVGDSFIDALSVRMDVVRVLIGHSRGGEAASRAAQQLPYADAVVSIAATYGAYDRDSSGSYSFLPLGTSNTTPLVGVSVFALVGSRDGDTEELQGMHYYDQASSVGNHGWVKAQRFVGGANHNYWNERLTNETGASPGPSMDQHQPQILAAWSTAFVEMVVANQTQFGGAFGSGDAFEGIPNPLSLWSYSTDDGTFIDDFEDSTGANRLGLFPSTTGAMQFSAVDGLSSLQYNHRTALTQLYTPGGAGTYHSPVGKPLDANSVFRFRIASLPGDGMHDRLYFPNADTNDLASRLHVGVTINGAMYSAAVKDVDGISLTPPDDLNSDRPEGALQSLRVPLSCMASSAGGALPESGTITDVFLKIDVGGKTRFVVDDFQLEAQ